MCAQRANIMPPTEIQFPGASWPSSSEGLVLAWENQQATPEGMETLTPTRTGKAFWNARGGMDVRGGTYEIPGAGTKMLRECGKSGAFTLEAMITPMVPPFDKAMRPVFSLEDDAGQREAGSLATPQWVDSLAGHGRQPTGHVRRAAAHAHPGRPAPAHRAWLQGRPLRAFRGRRPTIDTLATQRGTAMGCHPGKAPHRRVLEIRRDLAGNGGAVVRA